MNREAFENKVEVAIVYKRHLCGTLSYEQLFNPAWHESEPLLEADFLSAIRLQLLGRRTVVRPDTRALSRATSHTQDLSKATFPDNVSYFPQSELCLCQSGMSSLIFEHCLVHVSKGILNFAFDFMTLIPTRGIQSHRFFITVNNHLDGPKMSIRRVSKGLVLHSPFNETVQCDVISVDVQKT
jgi:hypothetical protein